MEQPSCAGTVELHPGREVLRGQAECHVKSTIVFFEFVYLYYLFCSAYGILSFNYSVFIYILIE